MPCRANGIHTLQVVDLHCQSVVYVIVAALKGQETNQIYYGTNIILRIKASLRI